MTCAFQHWTVGKKHKRFVWRCTRCGRVEPYHAVLVLEGCKNPSPSPPRPAGKVKLVEVVKNGDGKKRLRYNR